MKWLNLGFGSLAGGFSRYAVAHVLKEMLGTSFPYGTLAINLSGCLLVGFLNTFTAHRNLISSDDRVLLMTGFCGAYTTFSAWMLQSSELSKDGKLAGAFINILASVMAGFLLLRLGEWLGSQF